MGKLILIVLVLYVSSSLQNELSFVQVVWRHGDRAPIQVYSSDPNGENNWPFGWGELTELGMKQQLTLGRLLRKKYIKPVPPLLNKRYAPKEVYIRSTNVNRTLVSAMCNLAGMYPAGVPGEDYPIERDWPSQWTPIPIHTLPENLDFAGTNAADCPRADQIHTEIKANPAYLQIQQENQKIFDYISNKTGDNINLDNIGFLNDVIYIESLYNLTQPTWVDTNIRRMIENLTMLSNEFFYGISSKCYSGELIRLRGGSLLKEIVDRMEHKIECLQSSDSAKNSSECKWINALKYYTYSAHDTTVAALASTFGDEERIVPGGLPHYTASLIIELWLGSKKEPNIKILYHSAFHQDYLPITGIITGCPQDSEFCPLEMFKQSRLKFMPNDIEKECQAK